MKNFLLFLILFHKIYSFWDGGHMIIATIAMKDLLNQENEKEILNFFEELTEIMNPMSHGLINDFIESSTWADYTSKFENNIIHHHITLPLNDTIDFFPNTLLNKENIKGTVISYIEKSIYNLLSWNEYQKSNLSLQFEKSFNLRYLIHLIGDIHQPLHVCSWFDEAFYKGNSDGDGDKGGNLYRIKYKDVNNLHSLWDSVLLLVKNNYKFPISDEDKHDNMNEANDLMKKYPKDSIIDQIYEGKYMKWVEESWYICKNYVHKGVDLPNDISTVVDISDDYIMKNTPVIERQLIIAGYRLSGILNSIWKAFNSNTTMTESKRKLK